MSLSVNLFNIAVTTHQRLIFQLKIHQYRLAAEKRKGGEEEEGREGG